MGAGGDDAAVKGIDEFGRLRRGSRSHFRNVCQRSLFVARIYPLRAVADGKVDVEAQAGGFFQLRYAYLLGRSRIDRGFVDDDVAALQDAAERLAGTDQRAEIGPLR